MRPITTGDPTSCALAYASLLSWDLVHGHRYRPRSGCTCQQPDACPAPGAHPIGQLDPILPEVLSSELATAPGASLICPTTHFDAIVLPRQAGMAAMVALDCIAPVPCIITAEHATLLVLPATARYALDEGRHPQVEVRSGPDRWVALPPSHGYRWDTPPWDEQTYEPVLLLHGEALRKGLTEALAHAPGARPRFQTCHHCGESTDDPRVVGENHGDAGPGYTVYACPDHIGLYPVFVSPLELIEAARQRKAHGS
jgi:hypothetical protein